MPPRKQQKVMRLLANVLDLSPVTQQLDHSPSSVLSRTRTNDLQPQSHTPTLKTITSRRRPPTEDTEKAEIDRVLNSTTEYVALFRVSRAEQAGEPEEGVGGYKKGIKMLSHLEEELGRMRGEVRREVRKDVDMAFRRICQYLEERVRYLRLLHERDLERVRRACRGRLADIVARIAFEAEKNRAKLVQTTKTLRQNHIQSLETQSFEMKKRARRCADTISKLRSQVARSHVILKRHKITEAEAMSLISDERLRTDDLLVHLQTALRNKEAQIQELTSKVVAKKARVEERGGRRRSNTLPYVGKRASLVGPTRRGSRLPGTGQIPRRLSMRNYGEKRRSFQTDITDIPRLSLGLGEAAESDEEEKESRLSDTDSDITSDQPQQPSTPPIRPHVQSILQSITSTYETRLHLLRTAHATRIATLTEERTALIQQYEQKYAEAQQSLSSPDIGEVIRRQMNSVCEVAQKLFPKGPREGWADVGVQCDLDPFGREEEKVSKASEKEVVDLGEENDEWLREIMGNGERQKTPNVVFVPSVKVK